MRTLSWGLHWGRRVQTQFAERTYADVGEEYQQDQLNCGEILPGELLCSGTCNPIRMYIYSTRHLGHRRRVRGSGEDYSRTIFASSFLHKYENPFLYCRRSKYNYGQEIWTGTLESSDVILGKVLKI